MQLAVQFIAISEISTCERCGSLNLSTLYSVCSFDMQFLIQYSGVNARVRKMVFNHY